MAILLQYNHGDSFSVQLLQENTQIDMVRDSAEQISWKLHAKHAHMLIMACLHVNVTAHSARILPFHFQARRRRRRLNLALVFCVDFVICIV